MTSVGMKIHRLCIIGVGAIGGSLARALRDADACGHIVGCSRRQRNLEKALALGVIDSFETDVTKAISGADMIVVTVPLGAMGTVFRAMVGRTAPNAVITDGGSAKRSILAAAQAAFGKIPQNLVPAHPIAGTEKSGVEASRSSLFQGRRVVITPVADTDPSAMARVRAMWQTAGADVTEMDAEHHDKILAATSHLPHVLAYTFVDVLRGMDKDAGFLRYAAGGFRDFSRIASSDPQMWADICLANTDAIIAILERFDAQLQFITNAIRRREEETIKALFSRAMEYRDGWDP
uniref:prephenate dehydrogenase n=1 Tax=Candidatus Kentrum sp. LFY TaxID=2126342 RepID=A0A450V0S9_9GAMM|nr:MAG: prephenate dehydrogenase [Candidatus Kentron sp. LFY]VFJ99783.1 MAG: prephenate dehydrogenase [Candidatus Kentron sp. LFY]VFK14309.1 MAG: prephenate dehydrogenase [Candidatus Kentron sp. LFY]